METRNWRLENTFWDPPSFEIKVFLYRKKRETKNLTDNLILNRERERE